MQQIAPYSPSLLISCSVTPDLTALSTLLQVDQATVRRVLMAWGPGKFDAELFLDGKEFRPTGNRRRFSFRPRLVSPAVNLHTWTGWGSVTHWNAFVANLEMHGKGTFFDPRLNDPVQFPVAARAGLATCETRPT